MNNRDLVQQVMGQLLGELDLYRSILAKTDDEVRRLQAGESTEAIQQSINEKYVLLDQVGVNLSNREGLLSAWADALPQLLDTDVAMARGLQKEVMSTLEIALERMNELAGLVAAAVDRSRDIEENMVRQRQASQAYQRSASPDARFIDRKS